MTQSRYLLKYLGTDKIELSLVLEEIAKDKSMKLRNGRWNIADKTVAAILGKFDKSLFSLEKLDSLGTELNDGFALYPYQEDIVKFCIDRNSALVAAGCGCGKTIIMLDTFLELKKQGKISSDGKCLVVAKSSLKVQWKREIERFSKLKAGIVDTYKKTIGNLAIKKKALEEEMQELLSKKFNRPSAIIDLKSKINALDKEIEEKFSAQFSSYFDIFIVNYETLRDNEVRKALRKTKLECVIADEVHLIKTDTSARSKALYEFSDIKYRYGATATPIKKNPLDAYGITRFIEPTLFKSKTAFSNHYLTFNSFGRVSGSKNEKDLNEALSKIMIVKTKEEVSSQLPDVVPVVRYCSLEPKQVDMTERLLKEIQEYKEEERGIIAKYRGNPPAGDPDLANCQANIMARQTFAQELANTEELLKESESNLAKAYITKSKSNKIELLLDLLEELLANDEKVVIFSKYRKLQPILEREIKKRFEGLELAFVNGEMSSEARYEEVYTKFRDNENCKVLLMSDAGAEGISISWCKYLIEMEPADSYLIQTQRRGRIERADSIHDTVYVYQLIAEGSYDEIGLKIIEKKEKYDSTIIKGNL